MTTSLHLADFHVIAVGLVYASVCSALPEAETTRTLNLTHPTGLSWGWQPSTEPRFATGQLNPCPCERNPLTHVHRLYTC